MGARPGQQKARARVWRGFFVARGCKHRTRGGFTFSMFGPSFIINGEPKASTSTPRGRRGDCGREKREPSQAARFLWTLETSLTFRCGGVLLAEHARAALRFRAERSSRDAGVSLSGRRGFLSVVVPLRSVKLTDVRPGRVPTCLLRLAPCGEAAPAPARGGMGRHAHRLGWCCAATAPSGRGRVCLRTAYIFVVCVCILAWSSRHWSSNWFVFPLLWGFQRFLGVFFTFL